MLFGIPAFFSNGGGLLDQGDGGQHGRGEDNDFGVFQGLFQMMRAGVNRADAEGGLQGGGAAGEADDMFGEAAFFQGEADGGADQAGAEEGDFVIGCKCHW